MSKLSPAVQAVLDAYEKANDCYREEWGQLAAALRAAADHDPDGNTSDEYDAGWRAAMDFVEGIADELEAQ